MKTKWRKLSHSAIYACTTCAWTCMCGGAGAQAQETEEKKESDYRNWFDVSVSGNLLRGDSGAFKERAQVPQNIYGGIESFHYEQNVGKSGLFEIDGRGIYDNHDYSLKLNLEDPGLGFVRGGYREFRTWYDGSGGYGGSFVPPRSRWFELYDEELHIDRGEAWFEGGLTLEGVPRVTFRYSHQFRDGRKDSTHWGETGRGLPTGSTRAIVPSYWDIDEERDIFQLDVEHTLAETDFGGGLRYEVSDMDNSRNIRRRPFEAGDRFLTQREKVDTDLFNVHAFQKTWLTEEILFTTGYSFTTLDTDVGGSRIYGADYDAVYDPLFGRRQQRDEGFFGLSGGSKLDQHVMNLNLMFTPWDHVTIVPSIRAENQEQKGQTQFIETNVGAAPAFTSTGIDLINRRERGFTDVTEGLEIRYTGITNWVLYTRAELLQGQGDLSEREIEARTGDVDLFRDTDTSRFTQKYVAGVNWYPLRQLNLAQQYYFKSRRNDYDHNEDSTSNAIGIGDRYPAFIRDQNFDTHDLNFRVTWRPISQLTLVTRYDFQLSTVDSSMDRLGYVESADITTHILSESVTWVPFSRVYLSGSINYVLDETDTPAVGALPGDVVQLSEQDYITGNASIGFVLTQKTDLTANYFIYYADNYRDNSAFSVPYNVSAEEHGVTLAMVHRLTPAQQVTMRYGWFTADDETSGGHNDYEAHMVSASYRYRF